ncbi:universal stress protein [Legionella fallonii]|uniref:Putative Universal stress protein UspA n=1 Tax=Legionella fallonii LLAP-10 TaxID=1212491 RepID=A0A098G572_9GAMM|nr:universal stress protein [Legionella fallonii]CEG57111.1 Putative Universal stress protein UspA [Legionella fallonii LLAP-10]
MKQFDKILFVSNGISDEIEALQHALRLASNNKTTLDILITCPPFNHGLEGYQSSYETFLTEKMHQSIETAKTILKQKHEVVVQIDVEWGSTPDIRIIQQVLRHSYDLVIKAAENTEETKGFKALDMSLLRKCPCALYLHRPFVSTKPIHIAVAIDPKDNEDGRHDLALRLLQLSHELALHYHGDLSIISCWDFPLEKFLRQSVFVDIPKNELDDLVMQESNAHYALLHGLIHEANIKAEPQIYHQKGEATELIPFIINEQKIDILVMGTVARTGISGFIIGNTAENILQKINCSLVALKPQGYVSPVKAY